MPGSKGPLDRAAQVGFLCLIFLCSVGRRLKLSCQLARLAVGSLVFLPQLGDLLLIVAEALIRSWKQITKFRSATSPAPGSALTLAGEAVPGTYDASTSRSWIVPLIFIFTISRFKATMISFGVPTGASRPLAT